MIYQKESKYIVYVPLFNFNWDDDLFLLNGFGKIDRIINFKEYINDEFNYYLSEFEFDNIKNATHWLIFEQEETDKISRLEKINIFLLALWIAKPTRTHVQLIFVSKPTVKTFIRVLDRFSWNKFSVVHNIDNECLVEVNKNISNIIAIYLNRKRLFNSLILNLNGCVSNYWQVAFVSFSAALEGILTYRTTPGITKRLAKSFACLTEIDRHKRDLAYKRFYELYNIRSDIIHGRAINFYDPDTNLRYLSNYEDLLRNIWKTIFNSKELIEELENNDSLKENYFRKIETGYTPPNVVKM
jgi:hypothetical protein